MILQCSRMLVAEDPVRKQLNLELKQYYEIYSLWNRESYFGQLFSRVSKCSCFSCTNCQEKHVDFYLKTETMTRTIKLFYLGRNLFKCIATVKRCRDLCIRNPLALECFLVPPRKPKIY